jgi:hypothetical protein
MRKHANDANGVANGSGRPMLPKPSVVNKGLPKHPPKQAKSPRNRIAANGVETVTGPPIKNAAIETRIVQPTTSAAIPATTMIGPPTTMRRPMNASTIVIVAMGEGGPRVEVANNASVATPHPRGQAFSNGGSFVSMARVKTCSQNPSSL